MWLLDSSLTDGDFQQPSGNTQSEDIVSVSENLRDIDEQLYTAVQSGSTESILSQLKDGAYLGMKPKMSDCSAVTLILQLPNGIKILRERLDEAITIADNGENSLENVS